MEQIREIIYLTDENGNIVYISPSAEPLVGVAAEEITGENGFYRFHTNKPESKRKGFDTLIYTSDRSRAQNAGRYARGAAYRGNKTFYLNGKDSH